MMNASNSTVALNWIDGAWVGAEQVREWINPATYEVIGAYADGGLEAARVGIAAAKRAFQTSVWAIDHELRTRVIGQIADAFERHRDSLLDVLAAENGKVKAKRASKSTWYRRSCAITPPPRSPRAARGDAEARQHLYDPAPADGRGWCYCTWNSPVVLTIRSLAPALAAGCAAVIKLPGQVAQVAHLMAKIMAEAPDLPKGVINLFFESGPMVPPTLSNRRTFP